MTNAQLLAELQKIRPIAYTTGLCVSNVHSTFHQAIHYITTSAGYDTLHPYQYHDTDTDAKYH